MFIAYKYCSNIVKIRLQLEEIINQNKIKFEKVGATAIQGSAKAIK